MDNPTLEPDPTPEEIDPRIVEIFRNNLTLQQYMAMYLSKQISWRETLEHSLILMNQQYTGALYMASQNLQNQCQTKLILQLTPSEPAL